MVGQGVNDDVTNPGSPDPFVSTEMTENSTVHSKVKKNTSANGHLPNGGNRSDLTLDFSDIDFTPGQKCFGEKSDVERVLDSRCPCLQSKCLHLSGSLVLVVLTGIVLIYFFRHYLKDFLEWLQDVNGWISGLMFICMFTIVSFPMTWGYIVLNVAAGYLYGFLIGIVTVSVSVVIGVGTSLVICRIFIRDFVQSKLQSEHLKAIIRVVESRRGFKVVVLTRLTPIPFGLQNGLFSVSFFCLYIYFTFVYFLKFFMMLSFVTLPSQCDRNGGCFWMIYSYNTYFHNNVSLEWFAIMNFILYPVYQ